MDKFRSFLSSTLLNALETPNLSEVSSSDSESDSDSDIEMAPGNNFDQFVEGSSLEEYLERFEAYLLLNRVTEEVQKTIHFIGVCGAYLYSRIKSACNPRTPMAVPYGELKPLLTGILCPRNLVSVERAKFHMRSQLDGESAASFALALRKMAQTCNFGAELESQLKDRFVVGLKDGSIRAQIIDTASLEEALAKATTSEISRGFATPSTSQIYQVRPQARSETRFRQAQPRAFSGSFNNRQHNNNGMPRKQKCDKCGKFCQEPCPAQNYICYNCDKRGHVASCCKFPKKRRIGNFEDEEEPRGEQRLGKCIQKFNYKLQTEPPLYVIVSINGIRVRCEVDSGAGVSVMSSVLYERCFYRYPLYMIDKQFVLADNSKCRTRGVMNVLLDDKHESQIVIVESKQDSPPLVGRTWLNVLFPSWRKAFSSRYVEKDSSGDMQLNNLQVDKCVRDYISEIKSKFKTVFDPHVSPIRNFLVNLKLKPNVCPLFKKASVIPYSLREKVSVQLEDLRQRNIIKKVDFSDWGSQIVLAPKKNGEIRVCCNYKPTLNPCLERNDYPIPNVDDLVFTLSGNKFFTLIDLSGAYLQLALDEESQKLTTINTPFGLFSYCRVPFGVKTAPGIFQEVIDRILHGLPGVVSYFDDILVGASSLEVCRERTHSVFKRLDEYNVQANYDKCVFFVNKIEYLGHCISEKGVSPSPEKIKAIVDASRPRDVTSLRAFLGLLNFYSKFLPDLQSKLHPLHELLRKNVVFKWNEDCENVFLECKNAIIKSPILSFYDPSKPLSLVCDAGPYGIGAILNVIENGQERPIYMASASLSPAERNYSQLHREALAIVFGLKKFHKFVYGNFVTIYTDCEPLPSILSGKKDISTVINSRFLRWMLMMQNYDFIVKHRSKRLTVNADALSRLPCDESTNLDVVELDSVGVKSFNGSVVDCLNREVIQSETLKNELYANLYEAIKVGWPNKSDLPEELRPFYKYKDSLDVENGCIYYGDRIFVPYNLRDLALNSLHRSHKGIVKSKQAARESIWWPRMDTEIESFVNNCLVCQTHAPNKKGSETFSWPNTEFPMERIHIDHFFFNGKIFLVIVDDFSKWIDIKINKAVSSRCVILSMKEFIASVGLPETIVSDNATCFNSIEFESFCKSNNIRHINSPQYHPQSNGLAERFVGIVKENLRKSLSASNQLNVEELVLNFLFEYRSNPLSHTGKSPANYLFNYKFRNNLNCLSKQAQSKSYNPDAVSARGGSMMTTASTSTAAMRNYRSQFEMNEDVFYYYKPKRMWVPAVIVRRISQFIYEIRLSEGQILRSHSSFLKKEGGKNRHSMKLRSHV